MGHPILSPCWARSGAWLLPVLLAQPKSWPSQGPDPLAHALILADLGIALAALLIRIPRSALFGSVLVPRAFSPDAWPNVLGP